MRVSVDAILVITASLLLLAPQPLLQPVVAAPPVYVPHPPVLFRSNADFGNRALCIPNAANGVVDGCGTASDPWRVSGWTFAVPCCVLAAISLWGTTDYVEIRQNAFLLGFAIDIDSADNVIIRSNTFQVADAVWIVDDLTNPHASQNVLIEDNVIAAYYRGITVRGDSLAQVSDLRIRENTITGGTLAGIDLSDAADVTITGNTITGNKDGLSCPFGGCLGVTIADNDISGNTGTAINGRWSGGIVRDNVIQNNLRGITGCVANSVPEIYGNNIAGNTDWGVSLQSCTVDATDNWWGDASGPSGLGPGSGDKLLHSGTGGVVFDPWLTAPNPIAGP